MPRYPDQLKKDVLRIVASGVPEATAARVVGVSRVTVSRWVTAARRSGEEAMARRGRVPAITPAEEPFLRAQLAEMPHASLSEHCARWYKDQGVRLSRTTMFRALHRLAASEPVETPAG